VTFTVQSCAVQVKLDQACNIFKLWKHCHVASHVQIGLSKNAVNSYGTSEDLTGILIINNVDLTIL